jgi:hypothetical protein
MHFTPDRSNHLYDNNQKKFLGLEEEEEEEEEDKCLDS